MTFRAEAEQAAIRWKAATAALPDAARLAGCYGLTTRGPYEVCLPPSHASLNLLPDARQIALDRFERAGIEWHHGTTTMCGNHLLSSQVQCANALAPMADQPGRLRALLGGILDVDEVLPFGDPVAPDDHVAFEWIGLTDHLGEWPWSKPRTRGANTTSADAAVRYRTSEGAIEVALIEWKYVESYGGQPLSGGETKMATRHKRYRARWDRPDSSVRSAVVAYEDLFVEPVYQLFRLQLLAEAMERVGELGAEAVRVVYAAPARNLGLRSWIDRPPFDALGRGAGTERTVSSVWRSVLRSPDRFVGLDTASLVAPGAPTSSEFKSRYGHLAG